MNLRRIAFIGARGGHYDRVLRALATFPQVDVVGVCHAGDESLAPILSWCDSHGRSPRVYDHYLQMLDGELPEVAVVCGPFECHAQMAIECIERGVHVIVEKPVALVWSDLERLHAVMTRHPQMHLAALQTARYQAGFYTAWQLVRRHAIGDVRIINAQKSYKLGRRGGFYQNRQTYGGTIPWVGSHAIDWLLWIGGHGIKSVYATHTTAADRDMAGTVETAAVCHFTLCGDRYASISIDMLRPTNATSHGDDWLRVVGTQGVMEVRPNSVSLINADNKGMEECPLEEPPNFLEDFAAQVEGRRNALIGWQDSLATTAASLLARESADLRHSLSADAYTTIPMKSQRQYLPTLKMLTGANVPTIAAM